jgi:hypothetical protein
MFQEQFHINIKQMNTNIQKNKFKIQRYISTSINVKKKID